MMLPLMAGWLFETPATQQILAPKERPNQLSSLRLCTHATHLMHRLSDSFHFVMSPVSSSPCVYLCLLFSFSQFFILLYCCYAFQTSSHLSTTLTLTITITITLILILTITITLTSSLSHSTEAPCQPLTVEFSDTTEANGKVGDSVKVTCTGGALSAVVKCQAGALSMVITEYTYPRAFFLYTYVLVLL